MNLRGEPRELSYAELRISPTFPEQGNVISVQTIGAGRNTEWNARSLETVNETKVGKVGWIDEFCPSARGLIVRERRNYFHTWSKQMAGTRAEWCRVRRPSKIDPKISLPKIRRIINRGNRGGVFPRFNARFPSKFEFGSGIAANLTRPICPLPEFVARDTRETQAEFFPPLPTFSIGIFSPFFRHCKQSVPDSRDG